MWTNCVQLNWWILLYGISNDSFNTIPFIIWCDEGQLLCHLSCEFKGWDNFLDIPICHLIILTGFGDESPLEVKLKITIGPFWIYLQRMCMFILWPGQIMTTLVQYLIQICITVYQIYIYILIWLQSDSSRPWLTSKSSRHIRLSSATTTTSTSNLPSAGIIAF